MINSNKLTFSYKKGNRILSDISFSIEPGQIYGILGDNGVGKTTLIQLMCGLLKPDSGKISYGDIEMFSHSAKVLENIFIVTEEPMLPAITLKNYIKATAPFYPKFSNDDMSRYLEAFEVSEDIHLKSLSMGQKKKVVLSFALATNVSVLLMDEPTNGLDISGKSHFRKFISSYMEVEGRSVVISTHQLRDVDALLDHIMILRGENLLIDNTIELINRALIFELIDGGAVPQNFIFAQPSPAGYIVVRDRSKVVDQGLNINR